MQLKCSEALELWVYDSRSAPVNVLIRNVNFFMDKIIPNVDCNLLVCAFNKLLLILLNLGFLMLTEHGGRTYLSWL